MDFTWDVLGKTPGHRTIVRKAFRRVTSAVHSKKDARAAAERDVQLTEALIQEHTSIVVVADLAGVKASKRVYDFVRHGLRQNPTMPSYTLVINARPWALQVQRWARKMGAQCATFTMVATEEEVTRALQTL